MFKNLQNQLIQSIHTAKKKYFNKISKKLFDPDKFYQKNPDSYTSGMLEKKGFLKSGFCFKGTLTSSSSYGNNMLKISH